MDSHLTILLGFCFIIFFISFSYLMSRYRLCPADKVLVVYGQTGSNTASKCIHGGGIFVLPIIQNYQYLDLTPIGITSGIENIYSKNNIKINIQGKFTFGISDDKGIMENAAIYLLSKSKKEISDLANNIIEGQVRLISTKIDINEIKQNGEDIKTVFNENISSALREVFNKIGLKLINIDVVDVY